MLCLALVAGCAPCVGQLWGRLREDAREPWAGSHIMRRATLRQLRCLAPLRPQVMLNPFHTPTSKITAPLFQHKVRQLARNYFR